MGWLTGWGYRKSHVINYAAGAGTLYQKQVTVHYGSGTDGDDDVYLNSHCRTDFGDVRFTDDDGTTLLDYWMESKVDSDYAVFWVEVADDLSTVNQTIYVYYGKADATTTSNLTNTFVRIIDATTPTKLALPMDEGTGTTTFDKSGNSNNGTITGATWVDGKFGKALSFDGLDDYVDCGNNSILNFTSQNFTITFWIKNKEGADFLSRSVIERSSGNQVNGYTVMYDGPATGAMHLLLHTAGSYTYVRSTNRPAKDVWEHWVATRNGIKGRLYRNGVEEVLTWDDSLVDAVSSEAPLIIGKGIWGFCKDEIDEVRIFNRALTATEISDMYNNYPFEVSTNSETVGKTLVRKYVSPEPSHGAWGDETANWSQPLYDILETASSLTRKVSVIKSQTHNLGLSMNLGNFKNVTELLGFKQTLGKTDIGTNDAQEGDFIISNPFLLTEEAYVTCIMIYVKRGGSRTAGPKTKCAIYSDDTGALIGQTEELVISNTDYQWIQFNFSSPVHLVPGTWALAAWNEYVATGLTVFNLYKWTLHGPAYYRALTYAENFPNPFAPDNYWPDDVTFSMYAVYSSDICSRVNSYLRTITGFLGLYGIKTGSIGVSYLEDIQVSDFSSTIVAFVRMLLEDEILTDSPFKMFNMLREEVPFLVGTLIQKVKLSSLEVIAFLSEINKRSLSYLEEEILTFTDSILSRFMTTLQENLDLSESWILKSILSLLEIETIASEVIQSIEKNISQPLEFGSYLSKSISVIREELTNYFGEIRKGISQVSSSLFSIQDSLVKMTEKITSASLQVFSSVSKQATNINIETLNITDLLSSARSVLSFLFESMILTPIILSLSMLKISIESFSTSSLIWKQVKSVRDELLSLPGILFSFLSHSLIETFGLLSSRLTKIIPFLLEELTNISMIRKTITALREEGFSIIDSLSAFIRAIFNIFEMMDLTDNLFKVTYFKGLLEQIASSESLSIAVQRILQILESLLFSSSIYELADVLRDESLDLSDLLSFIEELVLLEVIGLPSLVVLVSATKRTFEEIFIIVSGLSSKTQVIISQSLDLVPSLVIETIALLQEVISVIPTSFKKVSRTLQGYLDLKEFLSKKAIIQHAENIYIYGFLNFFSFFSKILTQTLHFTETVQLPFLEVIYVVVRLLLGRKTVSLLLGHKTVSTLYKRLRD